MKKFLLSAILMASIGFFNHANSQCAGGDITVFNFQVIGDGTGQNYNWSYNWMYNQGNASIQVAAKCGGVTVALVGCNPNLRGQANGVAGYVGFAQGTISFPDPCVAPALKEIEVRIYASSNCNGTFCPIAQPIILPVQFKSFTAARSRSNVSVTWETSSEQNSAGFFVQRNIGGKWDDVAYIPSQAPGGNSDAVLSYSYSDLNSVKGISQYRIMQVDLDGKSKYSDTRAVRGEGQIGKTTIFPNPSNNGNVTIMFDDANVKRDISVIDLSGKVIKQWRNVTNNNLQVENLPMGVFSVRILAVETGEQVVEKIVVNKR